MRPHYRKPNTAKGFALIALLAILTAGVLYFVVTALSPQSLDAYRTRATQSALVEARDALLGYAVQYRDALDAKSVFGYLPLPDLGASHNNNVTCTTEGCDAGNFAGNGANVTAIGRFPWRTIGSSPLRDGHGECLWLIVSGSHQRVHQTSPMNWDTLGHLDIVTANGANNLASILASPHERPIAVIFSPGPALPGQDRSTSAVDDVSQCGGNYDAANYLDPGTLGALAGVTNYFSGATNNASADTSTTLKTLSTQGNIHRASDSKLWPNACPAGANCSRVANDSGLALSPDTLFDALRKSSYFRTDINSMLDRMVGCLRDKIISSPGYTITTGLIPSDPCYDDTKVPLNYFTNWRELVFAATGSPTVNGSACPGVLMFANQRGTGQSRATPTEKGDLANYLENNFVSPSGPTQFDTLASGQAREQDIVRCIPSTASLLEVESPALTPLGFGQLVDYDPGTRTLTLGNENVTTGAGAPGGALFGCAWTPETDTRGKGFRAYFQFRFKEVGTSVGDNGFVFAAVDAENNSSQICGAAGSHFGYSGNNGVTPPLTFPKIGIEFDQGRNDGFNESALNPGRNDPCGTSGCGGSVGYNSHAAIVYWGHGAANTTDGVTLPANDDNAHGLPSSTSQPSAARPAPQNPGDVNATPPGIAFVDLRGKTGQDVDGDGGSDSYLYHVRVEVTALTTAATLTEVRAASGAQVDLASPGATLGGVTLSPGDRVLLTAQTIPSENGVYLWHGPSSAMTRASDADTGTEITQATIKVTQGLYATSDWRQTATIADIGADVQNWQLYVRDFLTQVWIERDSPTSLQIIEAMKKTTRPMALLYSSQAPKLSHTASFHDVSGAACGTGCQSNQICGADNKCHQPAMRSVRLGFTGSQRTQDQQVTIHDFFTSWLQ